MKAALPSVPLIAEHDTWISIDPVLGCPAGCAYCYLGPLNLRPARLTVRASPLEMVHRLTSFLAHRSLPPQAPNSDSTPICIGNYTDMFMSRSSIDYIKNYANIHARVLPERPICIVTKSRLQAHDLEDLDKIGHKIILFLSQSFAQNGRFDTLERGPTSTPADTARSLLLFRDLANIVPIHFYRPVTNQTVPDMDTAHSHLLLMKRSGAIASVAVGLKHGPGLQTEHELLKEFVGRDELALPSDGEILSDETRSNILKAAQEIGHPLYFNTSCAVALAVGKSEMLGTWRSPMTQLRCDPCICPAKQRFLCDHAREVSIGPSERLLSMIEKQLRLGAGSVYWDYKADAIRIKSAIRQCDHNRLMHLLPHRIIPERVIAEEAWLGIFATVYSEGAKTDQ